MGCLSHILDLRGICHPTLKTLLIGPGGVLGAQKKQALISSPIPTCWPILPGLFPILTVYLHNLCALLEILPVHRLHGSGGSSLGVFSTLRPCVVVSFCYAACTSVLSAHKIKTGNNSIREGALSQAVLPFLARPTLKTPPTLPTCAPSEWPHQLQRLELVLSFA